ncbi:MAG: hypothetical protein ABMA01_04485 [Chthoniobacteraceae bacterium]
MKSTAFLLLALGAVPAFALDLTPQFITTRAEGAVITRPYFADGEKKYALTLDTETDLLPGEGGPLFRFTKLGQADMRWRLSPFRVDVKFEGEALAAYERSARSNLPALAESVVLEGQVPNPWPVNGWQGHSFIFKFKTASGEVRQSVTFLNIIPGQQIVVTIASMAKDFEDAAGRGYDTIRRWHELDAEAVGGGS